MPAPDAAAARAEQLVHRLHPAEGPRRRMLVIVNPHATVVSDRLRSVVLHALHSRYEVEAIDTKEPRHATRIARETAGQGYDVIVAFGGDGTANEAANGLVGSDTPLACLPGGSTNVWCRTLGIPDDVIDATEHLLRRAANFSVRRVDLGRAADRHFLFGSGVGLDASVVERVDRRPDLKASAGKWFYTWAALSAFAGRYLVSPPRLRVRFGDRELEAVTVIVQNSDPFTYFGRRPIRLGVGAGLENGTLSIAALERARPQDLPTLIARLLSADPRTVLRHRQIEGASELRGLRVEGLDGQSFPVEADGDYLGEFDSVEYAVVPRALAVVA
jgi:diacylglycerol kinase family enzyme